MKKINLLIIGILAMFGFMAVASADPGVTLKCEKTEVKIGETTNCYVTITADTETTNVDIALDTSKYLIVSNPTANTKAGWSVNSERTKTGVYSFDNTSGITGSSQVFSFNVTLSEDAKNLSADVDCGQLCISAVTFNKGIADTVLKGTGTCFAPTVIEESCVGESCNPTTGTFMNYLVIVGAGIIAIATMLIIRRTSKFYRV